ncbi:unnamed protein product [Notodromas monacha]|uniref:Ubiquinone biosynthesis monooxygenase COQ6, mitochondrial n=1 Tax=Notodromas monacha TaxID=399045 RepID=A0A7R9BKW7_9CRUS|nr:unnamed protein product [Notodromas monacha]CAG0916580.1 unnamed protein product [Notodromas monacha]
MSDETAGNPANMPAGPSVLHPKPSSKSDGVKTKPGSKRRPVDPLKPKQPLSAYVFYSKDAFKQLKGKGTDHQSRVKFLSDGWAALPKEERQKYEEMAEVESERYKREMAAYRQKHLQKTKEPRLSGKTQEAQVPAAEKKIIKSVPMATSRDESGELWSFPAFSAEFLENNRKLEEQHRVLKEKIVLVKEESGQLEAEVRRLNGAVSLLDGETKEREALTAACEAYSKAIKNLIVSEFSSLVIPASGGLPAIQPKADNVMVYCKRLREAFKNGVCPPNFHSYRELFRQTNWEIFFPGVVGRRMVRQFSSASNHYDVVICGGGMVGLAAALAFARDPTTRAQRVVVIEQGKPPKTDPVPNEAPYGLRSVALNPSTVRFLERNGAWEHVHRWGTIRSLQVWESVIADSRITFESDEIARVVENDELIRVMKIALKDGDVEFRYGANLKAVELPRDSSSVAKLTLEGDEITASLVVGADGAKSLVRKAMPNSARSLTWEYDQQAVVANVNFSLDCVENEIGWQRFLKTGPIAYLPLTTSMSNLIWSTTRNHAKDLMKLSDEDFLLAVNDAFVSANDDAMSPLVDSVMKFARQVSVTNPPSVAQLPPRAVSVSKRASFPIAAAHAVNYVAPRGVLIGDAAHRVHPMAGMGVNLGFGDVDCLHRVVGDALGLGGDIGTTASLYPYESERQRKNLTKMLGIDALYRLYRAQFLPIALARGIGLTLTDSLVPVKSWIMDQASRY